MSRNTKDIICPDCRGEGRVEIGPNGDEECYICQGFGCVGYALAATYSSQLSGLKIQNRRLWRELQSLRKLASITGESMRLEARTS